MSGVTNPANAPKVAAYANTSSPQPQAAAIPPDGTGAPNNAGQYTPYNAPPRSGAKNFFGNMTQSLGGMAESLGNFSKNHFNSVLSAPAAAMAAPAFAAAGLAKGQAYDSKSNQKHPGILAGVAKDVGKVGGDLRNIGSDVKHFRVGHLILDSLRLAKDGSGVGRHAVKNAASDVIHAGNTIKRVSWNTGAAVRTFGKSEVGMLMQNLQGSYGNRARSAAPASA